MAKVRIFSTPTCPYCFALKRFLEEKGIEVESVDVTIDLKAQEEMIEKTKQTTVPVTEINGEYVVGFDRKKISELLNIKD
jgi:glutaredoxin-like YruB-family protein